MAVCFRWLAVAFFLVVVTGAAFQLALRTVPEDAEHVQENLLRRALFLKESDTDAPIQDRLEGLRAGWQDIRDNPVFGTGLGDSLTYVRAQIFHSGWMWVAVSAGVPTALALLLLVGIASARTLRTLAIDSENPLVSALRLGFFACLAALAGNALTWGSTLDIGDVSDWGMLLGLLAVTVPRSSPKEVAAVCPAEPVTAVVR
jgi:O-antigen ligase